MLNWALESAAEQYQ